MRDGNILQNPLKLLLNTVLEAYRRNGGASRSCPSDVLALTLAEPVTEGRYESPEDGVVEEEEDSEDVFWFSAERRSCGCDFVLSFFANASKFVFQERLEPSEFKF